MTVKNLSLAGAVFALALPLLSAPLRASAANVNVIAQAAGDPDPFTLSWVDSADGKVGLDDKMAGQIHDIFAGVQYIFTDNNQLLLGQAKGSDLSLILPAANQIHNSKNTDFVVHLRSKDGKIFLDGEVLRFTDNPAKGYAQFTLLLLDSSGASASTLVEQPLAFPTGTSSAPLQ
jgi:hypothetical protein